MAELRTEFELRLRECHGVVYRAAYGVLRDRADAEEVAQDAFLRAYRDFRSLQEPQKFRAWVARMSLRLALNRRRSAARSLRRDTAWMAMSTPTTEDAEATTARRELLSRLAKEIDRLPERLRTTLVLSAVQELNTREVAEILGVPEGTVRSRLHQARKELLRAFCDDTLR